MDNENDIFLKVIDLDAVYLKIIYFKKEKKLKFENVHLLSKFVQIFLFAQIKIK